jgi:hypothetical protein
VNRPLLPLRLVPRDPGNEEDAETPAAPVPAPVPETAALSMSGSRVSVRDQASAAVMHGFRTAWRRARDLARREGGLVNGLLAGKPSSVLEQCEYARSRAWVPPGHDGGLAERLGVIYHALIGRPGVAAGNLISAVTARPLRFFLVLFTVGAVALAIWLS